MTVSDQDLFTANEFQQLLSNGTLQVQGKRIIETHRVSIVPAKKVTKKLSDKTDFPPGCESNEEMHFTWWLEELKEAGYVKQFTRAQSFTLSEPVQYDILVPRKKVDDKFEKRELLSGHIYTPDFFILWDKPARGTFIRPAEYPMLPEWKDIPFPAKYDEVIDEYFSLVEIKPAFDQNNMTRLFIINQKWMMDKFGLYVIKIIPKKLFQHTFTPSRYLITDKSNKPRLLDYKTTSLQEYVTACHEKQR